jgi:hypothetical protein
MNLGPMLPLMTHCPMCKALYAAESVKLVKEQSHVRLYHSTCHSCEHGLFYYVVQSEGGVSAVGLVTDACGSDALRLADSPTITADECIKTHRIVANHSKDLCQNLLDIREKLA